jgi:hypothetical protein
MGAPEIKKTCPIAPVREDGTPGLCREDRCAWWTNGECAIVKIAKAVGGQKYIMEMVVWFGGFSVRLRKSVGWYRNP